MRNDIFNFKRFAKYFRLDIKNALSRYWIVLVGLMMVELWFFCIWIFEFEGPYTELDLNNRKLLFVILVISLSITMAVTCFGRLTKKKAGTIFATLPASALEKTLSMILTGAVVIPSLFTAGYLAADEVTIGLVRKNLWHKELLNYCYSRSRALEHYYKSNFNLDSVSRHYQITENNEFYFKYWQDTVSLVVREPGIWHEQWQDEQNNWYECGRVIDQIILCTYKDDTLIVFDNGNPTKKIYAGNDPMLKKAYSLKTEVEKPYIIAPWEMSNLWDWSDRDLLLLRKPYWEGTIYSEGKTWYEENTQERPGIFFSLNMIEIIVLFPLIFLLGALFFKKAKGTKTIITIMVAGFLFLLPFAGFKGYRALYMDFIYPDYIIEEGLKTRWINIFDHLETFWHHSQYFIIPLCLLLCCLIYHRVKKLTY